MREAMREFSAAATALRLIARSEAVERAIEIIRELRRLLTA